MTISSAAISSLEALINQVISLDPGAEIKLETMRSKVIRLEITGLNLTYHIVPDVRGVQLYEQFDGEADCILRGAPMTLARLALADHPAEFIMSGVIEVEGDSELASELANFATGLDIDWVQQLSRFTGDQFARQLAEATQSFFSWGRQTAWNSRHRAQEVLQEEARLAPGPVEVDGFIAEVDRLRDDLERLAARIERVSKQTLGKGSPA